MVCEFFRLGIFRCVLFLLRALDIEFQDIVVFRVNAEVAYRQMSRFERVFHDFRYLHRQFFHVKYRFDGT